MNWNKRMNDLVGQDTIVFKDSPYCETFRGMYGATTKEGSNYLLRESMDVSQGGIPESMYCYKRTLFNLVVVMAPKVIVELGVREGNSSDAFTRGLHFYNLENPDEPGHLTSFDPGGPNYLANSMFIPQANDYWDYYALTGEAGYAQYGDKIKNIDLLYIDTDPHSYEQMKMWLNGYWINNLSKRGIIVFDDCAPQHQAGVNYTPTEVWNVGAQFGVLKAVLEFIGENEERIDFAYSVCNVRSNGIGVIKLK